MNASADDRDPASSLRLLGEALAATSSLDRLARLVVRHLLQATGARRVALFTRDARGQVAAADAASGQDGAPIREVVALPLLARGDVAGVVVVQDAAERSPLDSFVPQAAQAVAATREVGRGDVAAARARLTGQVLHEVNNRLGAIQIYTYLLGERMRRGADTGGVEVATKLSSAVDRLGTAITGLATPESAATAPRSEADLDALVDACVAAAAARAGGDPRVVRGAGTAASVRMHEAAVAEALRLVLRDLGAAADSGPELVVSVRSLSEQSAEIAIEGALDVGRLSEALFAGESSELGRALLRDVVEGEAGTVMISASDAGGALLRIELGGGAE